MRLMGTAAVLCASACATVPDETATPTHVAEASVAFTAAGERGHFANGFADPFSGRLLTVNDPARMASVSKLVVAIGVMKLVEQGRLDLDADVSDYLGWPLRNPAFPGQAISLRHLLSHTSSIRDHDDQYAVPLGETVRAAMAKPASWDSLHGPGDPFFTYSNMNFPLVASIIERVAGERFDRWARRELFEPLRIDACFNWPTCSDVAVARAVVLTQGGAPVRDHLSGQRPACPVFARDGVPCDLSSWRAGDNGALFAPQGGLRISARDLARVGRMLLGRGMLDGVRIITPQSVDLLLAPLWRFDGANGDTESGFYCSYGLASHQIPNVRPGCNDDPARDGQAYVGHAGEAYGLRSGLWIDRKRGTGVAYFVTGLNADPQRGRSAFRAAEEAAFQRALALLRR